MDPRGTGNGDGCLIRLTLRVLASVVILLLFFSPPAFSQIQVRVRMIEASNRGSTVDPSLKDVHDELGSLSISPPIVS